jgi:hypothetical protein
VNEFEAHKPYRDLVAAAEKALRDALVDAGYDVLNKIHCRRPLDMQLWADVKAAFTEYFPKLQSQC